jgi:Spy/CpxP family protein refolding chaperone
MKNHASMSLLTRTVAAAALALGLFAAALPAQDQPNNPPPREGGRRQGSDNGNSGGGGGGGVERQRPDMQQIRKAMSDRLKESLGSSDDEWRVLEPQIEKVVTLQRQSSPMMAMWGRGGGRGRGPGSDNAGAPPAGAPQPSGPRGDGAQSELSKASQELSTLVADQSASNDAINAKIKAFRAAREKARAELTAAQKELRELLSLRQEATLVSMGLLD